jgi:hypothetical protein
MDNIIKGVIISGQRGGGYKCLYQQIDFWQNKNNFLIKLQPYNMILIVMRIHVSHIMRMVKNDIFYISKESKLEVLLFLV